MADTGTNVVQLKIKRRRPLCPEAKPGDYGVDGSGPAVTLSELRPNAMFQIGAWPGTVDDVAGALGDLVGFATPTRGRLAGDDETSLFALAPGRWLGISSDAALLARLEQTITSEIGAVTDLSHARACLRVEGREVRHVLRKGIVVDLHEGVFPVGAVAQTTIHHMAVTLARRSADAFDVHVFRGFARSFWHWITDACTEFGYRVTPAAER